MGSSYCLLPFSWICIVYYHQSWKCPTQHAFDWKIGGHRFSSTPSVMPRWPPRVQPPPLRSLSWWSYIQGQLRKRRSHSFERGQYLSPKDITLFHNLLWPIEHPVVLGTLYHTSPERFLKCNFVHFISVSPSKILSPSKMEKSLCPSLFSSYSFWTVLHIC